MVTHTLVTYRSDVGEGRIFGRVDFGQRENQERNSDRDNAVAEDNDPFDTCLSFMCHLLAQPFVRSTSSVGKRKVPESAKVCAAVFAELERDFIRSRTGEALSVRKDQGMVLGRPRSTPDDVVARVLRERTEGESAKRWP